MPNTQRSFIVQAVKLTLGLTLFTPCLQSTEYVHPQFKHLFSVGVEGLHYHYDEKTTTHKNFMKMNGLNYGLNGFYQLTYRDTVFVRPEVRFVYGRVKYESHEGAISKRNKIPNFIAETRLLGGGNVSMTRNSFLSPFLGLGYRYKSDDLRYSHAEDGRYGYKRVNELLYVPIGARLHQKLNEGWFLEYLAEYDWMLKGQQLSYLMGYTVHNTQKHGYGLRAEFLAGYRTSYGDWTFGPYVNFWNIADSNKVFVGQTHTTRHLCVRR